MMELQFKRLIKGCNSVFAVNGEGEFLFSLKIGSSLVFEMIVILVKFQRVCLTIMSFNK